jgi:hypothetical protein
MLQTCSLTKKEKKHKVKFSFLMELGQIELLTASFKLRLEVGRALLSTVAFCVLVLEI